MVWSIDHDSKTGEWWLIFEGETFSLSYLQVQRMMKNLGVAKTTEEPEKDYFRYFW